MRLQCNHDRLRRLPVRAVIFSLVVMGVYAARVDADPTVHFELRLAPGQDDAVMTLGDPADDTLQIELWGEVSDAAPGTKVRWHGVFPRVSQDGVISYAGDYAASVFTFGCLFPASDNTPSSGDFSATCIDALGIFDGVGAPALWGTFSVSAVAVGQVSYDFAPQVVVDQQVTEWGVTLDVGTLIMPELINLFDSDCGDGSCNVTGSVDPALAVIEVVDMPQVARSPDADEDGDVDFQDYSALQACVIDTNGRFRRPVSGSIWIPTTRSEPVMPRCSPRLSPGSCRQSAVWTRTRTWIWPISRATSFAAAPMAWWVTRHSAPSRMSIATVRSMKPTWPSWWSS